MDVEEKIKAILEICKSWAFDEGENWLISAKELAWQLNNCWYAPLFFKEWELRQYNIPIIHAHISPHGLSYGIEDYSLPYLERRVMRTLIKIDGQVIKRRGCLNIWLRIPKVIKDEKSIC